LPIGRATNLTDAGGDGFHPSPAAALSGVKWCIADWSKKTLGNPRAKIVKNTKVSPAPRASVTFSADIYETLGAIAKRKRVSIAWVVRDATEKYVADQRASAGTP
jgi:hypothetical protein